MVKIIAKHSEKNMYKDALEECLVAYNDTVGPKDGWKFVGFYALNEQDKLVGGVQGAFEWDWLMLKQLWVAKRQNGLGTKLLLKAEEYAKKHNKTGVILDTLEFQAKSFYEKHGYEVFGVVDKCAGKFKRYFMKKAF
ncbi:MAG: GNAT family N-acetyltransferase [Alphaproteobacteria bacterium]